MSGVEFGSTSIRKGRGRCHPELAQRRRARGAGRAAAAVALKPAREHRGGARATDDSADEIAKTGGTPLAVARDGKLLGVIHLKDIVKGGIRERFAELRRMGIRTIMITGDNPTTAAAIAAEAGVDDFLAQATPEDKLQPDPRRAGQGQAGRHVRRRHQRRPALAQADVGVAMNTGTVAAREAGNMVDLDSNPTKLIEVVEIGKQLLMTRGALTTFSIANDVAKYFAIIPAMFLAFYPQLQALNIMNLATPAERHPVGDHLQRADHHRPDPAGTEGRRVPPDRRRAPAAPQPADLWSSAASSFLSSASRPSTSLSRPCTWLEENSHVERNPPGYHAGHRPHADNGPGHIRWS